MNTIELAAHGPSTNEHTSSAGLRTNVTYFCLSKIGSGDRATTVYYRVCFDQDRRLKFFGSPGYSMEFHDYHKFGKKQISYKLVDHPEPGTALLGQVTQLEDLSKAKVVADLFSPLKSDEDRFLSIEVSRDVMEKLSGGNAPIVWPPVHSGITRGRLAVYLSVDSNGQVREAWPLGSDNAGLDDSVREQVRHWKMRPATDNTGKRVQADGSLGFAFETKIEVPLPKLSDAEVRQLATKIVEPEWPSGALQPGQIVEADISVNEKGEVLGTGYSQVPSAVQGAVMNALQQWTFRPLIRDGKPQYFHGTVNFTAR